MYTRNTLLRQYVGGDGLQSTIFIELSVPRVDAKLQTQSHQKMKVHNIWFGYFIVDFREDIGLYKLLCRSAWYDKGGHLATRGTLLYKNISKHAHVKPSHILIHSEAQSYLYRSFFLPIRTFARLTVCFNCVGLMSANRASEHLF